MPPELHLDYETRSTVDLKKTGQYAYAEGDTTDVWMAGYAFDDEPVSLWLPGQPCPPRIVDHVQKGRIVYAHNAPFERAITRHVMPIYGWPQIPIRQWRCTMAMALAMSLPGSLENAAAAIGLDATKDMDGHRLMIRMAKPRRRDDNGNIVWWDDPDRVRRLGEYCKQDVVVERMLHKRLLPLSAIEQELWFLDQEINDRGVHVDSEFCEAALAVVRQVTAAANEQMRHVTDGEVSACSNTNQLHAWLKARGVDSDSISKGDLTEILARPDLPGDVLEAIHLRLNFNKASVKKIQALLNARSQDGNARGLLQFHAASTGRWAGRRFQPQNIKRPEIEEDEEMERAIAAVASGKATVVQDTFPKRAVLSVVGDCVRSMVTAKPGNRLLAADFSNIEGRGIAWLAGEEWKLEAFREFDRGEGPDLYKVAAGKTFGVDASAIDKPKRQVGKVQELAFGYQGGAGAYRKMAVGMGIDMGAVAKIVLDNIDPDLVDYARDAWKDWPKVMTSGWIEDEWVAVTSLVRGWRNAHSNIEQFWKDLESAAIEAIMHPGSVTAAGKYIRFKVSGSFLFMRLPSGRVLCYPYPSLREVKTQFGNVKLTAFTKGIDAYTRKWGDNAMYGGLWSENATQAIARCCLSDGMFRVEKAGYPIVLHVHDELVAELPFGEGDAQEFFDCMAVVPDWAPGFPIAVAGWEGVRYRK
jgi:DNA polymerase bacteriophage-type